MKIMGFGGRKKDRGEGLKVGLKRAGIGECRQVNYWQGWYAMLSDLRYGEWTQGILFVLVAVGE